MKNTIITIILSILLASSVFAAADLGNFPNMFVKDNDANVLVIVGKVAKAEDVLGAVDVVVAIQHEVGSKRIDIARKDDEVKILSAQNTIIIGGPCANSAAAKLLGYPSNCLDGFEVGKGYLKLYEFENGNIALLVAGTLAVDTRRTTNVLANYEDYSLKGTEMVISDISLSEITIN